MFYLEKCNLMLTIEGKTKSHGQHVTYINIIHSDYPPLSILVNDCDVGSNR